MTPSVELRGITKWFGTVLANNNAGFTLRRGEIHSLVGANGAGKSTLVKILYGMLQPDAGAILINGTPCIFHHPKDAREKGIGMIHQEMLLVESKTVLENIILGAEPVRRGFIRYHEAKKSAAEIIDRYNLQLDLRQNVRALTVGERQRILLTRLLYQNAKILLLDEPAAALTPQETETLFSVLSALKNGGASILFISHKLPEVMKFSDRITVMRGGAMVKTLDAASAGSAEVMELMCGEKLPAVHRHTAAAHAGDAALELKNLRCSWGARPLQGISITVRKGEIAGILGVDGNGQKELEEIIAGETGKYSGEILLHGVPYSPEKPQERRKQRIGYIPSHREKNGIIPGFTLAENIILGRHREPPFCGKLLLHHDEINALSDTLIREYDIQPPRRGARMSVLSGGNQQKTILCRVLHAMPAVLFAFNPARGVDIKTAYAAHRRLLDCAAAGTAVLAVLTDISEAMTLCHKIAVLYGGRIVRTFTPEEYAEPELGYYMIGGSHA